MKETPEHCACNLESFGNILRVSFVEGNRIAFDNLHWLVSKGKIDIEQDKFTCEKAILASIVKLSRSVKAWETKGKCKASPYLFRMVKQVSLNGIRESKQFIEPYRLGTIELRNV